ncbi:hypothetical protein GCM10020295_05560 [Streptomyces cinereospinus]
MGAVGHALGAAGAVEAAVTVLTLQRQVLPPTVPHEDPDPGIALHVVAKAPRDAPVGAAFSASYGFGGQKASLASPAAAQGARARVRSAGPGAYGRTPPGRASGCMSPDARPLVPGARGSPHARRTVTRARKGTDGRGPLSRAGRGPSS